MEVISQGVVIMYIVWEYENCVPFHGSGVANSQEWIERGFPHAILEFGFPDSPFPSHDFGAVGFRREPRGNPVWARIMKLR